MQSPCQEFLSIRDKSVNFFLIFFRVFRVILSGIGVQNIGGKFHGCAFGQKVRNVTRGNAKGDLFRQAQADICKDDNGQMVIDVPRDLGAESGPRAGMMYMPVLCLKARFPQR